jgi:choline dehydrogenase
VPKAVEEADYVVVGAGSAGCVLANRLSAEGARVVLLEAGGRDRHIKFRVPLAFRDLWLDRRFSWNYQGEPEPSLNGRQVPVPRGKVLGGSSSINGMLYSRGHPRDYDQWRQMGCAGWGYADVLPYYKRAETDWRGEGPYHGGSGPLPISRHKTDNALYRDLVAAAAALGYPESRDFHGAAPEGFGPPDFTVSRRGRRASTAAAYLVPAMARKNLRVETGAQATRVVVEGGRAVAVEYLQDGERRRIHAAQDIVLSGGAYNSPQLLMLSGIGPADALRGHGIDVVQDLPGVGKRLQDHAGAHSLFECQGGIAFDRHLRFDRLALAMVEWALLGRGIAAGLPVTCNSFVRTREGLERPDVQILFTPVAMDAHVWFPGLKAPRGHFLSNAGVLLHPESMGEVTLASADPLAAPRIRFNLLATENDRASLIAIIRIVRELFATAPFARHVGREVRPGPDVVTDADIVGYLRQTTATAFHPVGTCRMGVGEDAVVDPELRVRGIEALRVADASVMPIIIGGNTNAPSIMIGEKASDLVLGRPPLPAAV